jgi:hypothetical protein
MKNSLAPSKSTKYWLCAFEEWLSVEPSIWRIHHAASFISATAGNKSKVYSQREEEKTEIFNVIEMYYNPVKRHSHTSGVSTANYKEQTFLESNRV